MLKINFKNKKIILINLYKKNTLKNNNYYSSFQYLPSLI